MNIDPPVVYHYLWVFRPAIELAIALGFIWLGIGLVRRLGGIWAIFVLCGSAVYAVAQSEIAVGQIQLSLSGDHAIEPIIFSFSDAVWVKIGAGFLVLVGLYMIVRGMGKPSGESREPRWR